MKDLGNWLENTSEIKILSREDAINSPFARLKAIASNNDPKQQKDLMYIEFILCHEGSNNNGDFFFREELENSYYSAVHKVYNWEHNTPIVGTITDSILVKPPAEDSDQRWRIECAAVVWKWLFPTYAGDIKEGAKDGSRRNSMECYFSDYVYVVGDESNIYTREEKPELEKYINKSFGGAPVYRGMRGVIFGGAGCVENPADKGSIFKSVAARKLTETIKIRDINLDEVTLQQVEEEVKGLKVENTVVANDTTDSVEDAVESVVATDAETQDNVGVAEAQVDDATEDITEQTSAEDTQENSDSIEAEEQAQDVEPQEDNIESTVAEGETVVESDAQPIGFIETEGAMVDDILSRWAAEQKFWDSFGALRSAIENIMWETAEKDNRQAKITEEIQAFANVIFNTLPTLMEYYGIASTKANSDSELENATQEIEALKLQLQSIIDEYDVFKAQIEQEKVSAQLEQLAQKRVSDLLSAGLKFSDERIKSISNKVKEQSEEEYLDFKAMLVEARFSLASENSVTASTDAENSNIEETEESQSTNTSFAGLNVESEMPPSLLDRYADLVKEMKIFKDVKINK